MRKFAIGIQLLTDDMSPRKVKEIFSTTWKLLPFTHSVVFAKNPDMLDICVKESHNKGAKIFVWKQIFHQIGEENEGPQQLVGLDLGLIHKSWICPSNVKSTRLIIEELRFILDNHDVDGLFIDVFRYPSMYDGLTSMLSCFCDSCMTKATEMSINLEKTRRGIKDFVERIRLLSKEEIVALKEKGFGRAKVFDYVLHDPHILNFLKFRSNSINDFVKDIEQLVKESGRELGLDVFSPSLSWLVGQDYTLLKDNCSWMKPMVYCTARGTACLPAEIMGLARDLQKLNPRLSDNDLIYMISHFLEAPLPYENLNEIETKGLPNELVRLETARAKEAVEQKVPIYTGIEAVVEEICSISPERAESYVKNAIEGGADGIVLSWDIALVPIENLEAINKTLIAINP